MQETDALQLMRRAIMISLELTMPALLLSLVIGVAVSLFQAVTQIQEQTLTFVPKIVVLSLVLIVLGPWMLHALVGFTSELIASLPRVIH